MILHSGTGCTRQDTAAAKLERAQDELAELNRKLRLKRSSLKTAQKTFSNPKLTALKPSVQRLIGKLRGEISSIQREVDLKKVAIVRLREIQ